MPFYYEAKIIFVIALMSGSARSVFHQFLKPTLALHEEMIDEHFETIKSQTKKRVGKLGAVAVSKVKQMGSEALINGGIIDSFLKSGEDALGGGSVDGIETSPAKTASYKTLQALVEGYTHVAATPCLGKAVPKAGATGEKGGMDYFHGGCSQEMAEGTATCTTQL